MKVNDVYQSPFLQVGDLEKTRTRSAKLTIQRVEVTQFQARKPGERDRSQLVLEFDETQKLFGLNKINAQTIARLYGDESDFWVGRKIVLEVQMVTNFGTTEPAIRVKLWDDGARHAPQGVGMSAGPGNPQPPMQHQPLPAHEQPHVPAAMSSMSYVPNEPQLPAHDDFGGMPEDDIPF